MGSVRMAPPDVTPAAVPCGLCGQPEGAWDRIAGRAYCPNCEEALALGEAPALIARAEKKTCAVCGRTGTLCYLAFPWQAPAPVAMDLCGEHLRGLLGRRLGPHAFHQLRRQLAALGLQPEELFLLHSAFYDRNGRALQPASGVE